MDPSEVDSMSMLQAGNPPNTSKSVWPDALIDSCSPGSSETGVTNPQRRLDAGEFRRRLLHILPGFLPFLLWIIPHADPWGPILINVVVGITVLIVGIALMRFHVFARPSEHNGNGAVLGYALPVLGTMWLCRGYEEVGVMTLAILAFGDGSATLGGLLIGGKPLPWNPQKTVAGLMSFWIIGGYFATVAYWGEAHPGVPWLTAASIALPTVFFAGLLESLPLSTHDNFRVGVLSALLGIGLHHWQMG